MSKNIKKDNSQPQKSVKSEVNLIQNDLDVSKLIVKVESGGGTIPVARFGNTLTPISATKVIMFGGAVGDPKRFDFSNETYSYNLNTKIWTKLESKFLI